MLLCYHGATKMPRVTLKTFAEEREDRARIKSARRRDRIWSVKELAKELGVPPRAIRKYKSGLIQEGDLWWILQRVRADQAEAQEK